MVRPTHDLSLYQFQLEEWRSHDKLTNQEILQRLASDYSLEISQSTLYRNFRKWGTSFRTLTQDTEELRDRIKYLFFQQVLNDHFLLLQLHSDGFIITKTGLSRIRRELGLWRRQDEDKIAPQLEKYENFSNPSPGAIQSSIHTAEHISIPTCANKVTYSVGRYSMMHFESSILRVLQIDGRR